MPKKLIFEEQGWLDYVFWQECDKKMTQRINKLIENILRSPYEGLGKPEALKHGLQGFWSRRIDEKNRLVYRVLDDQIQIVQCRAHYD